MLSEIMENMEFSFVKHSCKGKAKGHLIFIFIFSKHSNLLYTNTETMEAFVSILLFLFFFSL